MKNLSHKISLPFRIWLAIAVPTTLLAGLVYATVQNAQRSVGNDPQITITADVGEALSKGADPQAIASQAPLDISKSLDPFVIVYSSTGTPVSSSGQLDGNTPTPPSEIFDKVKSKGQQRFTWQPKTGVRIAAVVDKYEGESQGFILAGRSLREVESREKETLMLTVIAWAATLILSLVFVLLFFPKTIEHKHEERGHEIK